MKEKFEKFTFTDSTLNLKKVNFKDIICTINPVVFDTNFLFVTFEFKIDIISEIKRLIGSSPNFYIYEGTIDELKSVERKGDKNKRFLSLIVKMLNIYDFKIIKSVERYVDNQVLSNLDKKVIIATNDKELRQKIWDKGYRVLYMRQKAYLELK